MTQLTSNRKIAYEMIVNLIVDGGLAPNQPLSERTLSELIGIGRMPVREAIKELARDGLLEVVPLKGTYVRGLSLDELGDLYEVRAALEGLAAYSAAQQGGSEELEQFRDVFLVAQQKQPDIDWKEISQSGADFHMEIFRAARNDLLLETYRPIRMRFRIPIGLSQTYDREWVVQSLGEHIEILDHIMNRRAQEAQLLITEHLYRAFQSKRRILSRMTRGNAPVHVVQPKPFR